MSEAKLLLDAVALADMHRRAAEIEALERRRGRPLSAGSPLLLALLASPPGTPLWSPLPAIEESLMTSGASSKPFRPARPSEAPRDLDPDGIFDVPVT